MSSFSSFILSALSLSWLFEGCDFCIGQFLQYKYTHNPGQAKQMKPRRITCYKMGISERMGSFIEEHIEKEEN